MKQDPFLKRYLSLLQYELALQEAEDDLLRFAEVTMPVERRIDDPAQTKYQAARHHRFMADLMMRVERGEARKVIINTGPRYGKSEICTRRFSAWYAGRHPDRDIIIASYNAKFAEDFGKDFQEIVASQRFRQVFPEYRLKVAAVDHCASTQGGNLYFLGRGSTTTGRGADCFPAGTMISTDQGLVAIEDICDSPTSYKVLSVGNGKLEYKSVQAARSRKANGLRRITLASGRVVEVTGCHRIFTGSGWKRARDVAPGDYFLRLVRQGEDQASVRHEEARKKWPRRALLLEPVLGEAREPKAVRGESLLGLQRPRAEGHIARTGQDPLLLGEVQEYIRREAQSGDAGAKNAALLDMPSGVCGGRQGQGQAHVAVLQRSMRQRGALPAHDERRQSEVEKRRYGAASETCGAGFSEDADQGAEARHLLLHSMRNPAPQPACSPHRQRADKQSANKPCVNLPKASPAVAQAYGEEAACDPVSLVERVRGNCVVYDIQVEGNHNFFAEGYLVHNCIIVDDPTKNEQEAASADFREKCWQWFTQTLLTRRHTDKAALVISQTRWHEDDIVGRLTDPANPAYTDELNAGFEVINLPVEAVEDDPLGREVGEPLWPERFNKAYLAEMRAANPNAFSALYQCDPVPDSGVFYQKDSIFEYDPTDLPDRLTMYAASDHAVSTKNINDRTCLIPWGVDERGDAWVLPDIVWGRIASDDAVERMIDMIKKHKPVFWYAEKGQIAKSIGPFLQKRMDEEQVYVPMVLEMRTQDKVQYAHSARARCAQGRIRFPRFAPWWAEAKKEMLKFPNARFDDFVDTVSIIGMKVNQHTGPGAALLRKQEEYGTFGWLKKQFADQDRRNAADKARAGW